MFVPAPVSARRWTLRLLAWVALLGCGTEAPAAVTEPTVEAPAPAEPADEAPADEAPTDEAPADEDPTDEDPSPEGTPPEATASAEVEEARRGFLGLLAQREDASVASPSGACDMGCVVENDARLLAVTALALEGDGSPTSFEVRVVGRDPLVRTVRVEGSIEAWAAYQEGEARGPWVASLERAMPALPGSRPARDLVSARAPATFSLNEYAPLVALGGALEGRFLYWHTARYAHHLYLVHGPEHQMRLVASLPLTAGACDGDGATTACVHPVGIDGAYAIPGAPELLLRLYHPEAGHGMDGYSTLLVSLADDAALRPSASQEAREIEASLSAPGPRVRAFSIELREGEPCEAGCVYFREDRTFSWSFPEQLADGVTDAYSVRRRDGTFATPFLPQESAAQAVEDELGEATTTLARDVIARAAVAAWSGFAYSPLVELGPPHMGRRLVFETGADADVLFWVEGETRSEVGRIERVHDDPLVDPVGPWGIDRVLAPEGAGYPLIVVAVASLPRTRVAVRHRVVVLPITHAP